MATTQIKVQTAKDEPTRCPRCNDKILIINGTFIRWMTCPKCKYKKLLENTVKPPVKITSMMDRSGPI